MITVERLTKRYGPVVAVDDVSFTVSPGQVTGFLGPNGAGKSTTMRVMCGLTPATSGTTAVLGKAYRSLPNPGRHVGVLLDASAQHSGRTGREVLALGAQVMGVPQTRVEDLLHVVGLTDHEAARRVRNYSLGMRQRLGIAHALLGDPQVLILDEPANGLDPAGIRWMRDLLRCFADEGGTVFLSSHLINEIERIADEIVVIGRGRIVAHGTKDELLGDRTTTFVRAIDEQLLANAPRSAGLDPGSAMGGGLTVDADVAAVGAVAAREGITLTELRAADTGGLEDLFLRLTSADAREEVAA